MIFQRHRPAFCLPILLAAAMLGLCAAVRAAEPASDLDARQTVVIANRQVPESIELANYYMTRRGIPTNHLCVLDLPLDETIARRFFETKLRDPLQAFLREQGLVDQVPRDPATLGDGANPYRTIRHRFRYLVSMYGVPLRIAESRPFFLEKLARLAGDPYQRDGASVDSELACLLWDGYALKGFQVNPAYNEIVWSRREEQPRPVLIAARLDGPDIASVRRMIDDAIATETNGLTGRAYIDMRSIRDPDYYQGDYWMREAGHRLNRAGYDVIVDTGEPVFPSRLPMDHAAIYLGWYAEHAQGPFLHRAFRFQPGAVAYHLHSSSAQTLRSTNQFWAGPLIAAGAAAVMGAVNEPFLGLTPDLQIFIDRLCAGYTFGESAYMAQRGLSWQITVVGDPLYRPIPLDIDQRMKNGQTDPWLRVMKMNLLANDQRMNLALQLGRSPLVVNDPVVHDKMADLYARNELWAEAVREYELAINQTTNEVFAMRMGRRLIQILRVMNNDQGIGRVREALATRWPDSDLLPVPEESRP